MPKHTQHDSPRKNRFIGAVQSGLSITKAAADNNISRTAGSDIWHKFLETGSTHNLPCSGRPTKVTPRMTRSLVQKAKKNRRKPLPALGKEMTPTLSGSTVRRVLHKEGLHRRKARKVVYLKHAHKVARRKWAKDCKEFTEENWERIIWSDESYIYIGDDQGTVWVTRAPDEEYDEDCVIPTFKQSSIRLMVWGCIMHKKKGPLVILEYPGGRGGGMTADRYQEQVLDKVLYNYYLRMSEEKGMVLFQQDGASSHTAKSTRAWFERNGIEIFPHPVSSPDLSPIEPVWKKLKALIRSRPHIPSSLDELKIAVREAWDQITDEDVEAHTKHMGDRVTAVLGAKGGHTKF
jgi:transposase